MFLTEQDGNFPILFSKMTSAIATATETLTTNKCCLCKTGDFAGKFEQHHMCLHLFDLKVLFDRDHHLLIATASTININLRTPLDVDYLLQ